MRIIESILALMTFAATFVASILLVAVFAAESAPQQAALAATSAALAVVPYVTLRAWGTIADIATTTNRR
jgi:hypothetical protein